MFFQLIDENGFKKGYPGIGGRGTAPDYMGKFLHASFRDGFMWGAVEPQDSQSVGETLNYLNRIGVITLYIMLCCKWFERLSIIIFCS